MKTNHRIVVCLSLGSMSCAADVPSPNEVASDDEIVEVEGLSQALCADTPTNYCSYGRWPNGVVNYSYSSQITDTAPYRAAMDRWEAATANTVRFVFADGAAAKIRINPCNASGGNSPGYDGCQSGCDVYMCGSIIDHELGHVLGFRHEHARYDRDHYMRHNTFGCGSEDFNRCGQQENASDFGPFDYHSSLMYDITHPDLTRWDGTSVCPNLNADNTCNYTVQSGPKGWPTKLDGAAAVELYRMGTKWSKFKRTQSTAHSSPYAPTTLSPFNETLASGVTISSLASPAVETWEGGSLAMYVRGTDGKIYKKWRSPSTPNWSGWENLGQPSGIGSVSDPAVVSWANGRTDLVVRRGDTVYIKSTPTWSSWQSLGGPASTAASAPAITSFGPNHLDIFIRGADTKLYHKWCSANCLGNSGTWSNWEVLGQGTFKGKPAVVSRASGVIDVFLHGTDDKLWSIHYENGWGNYFKVDEHAVLGWNPSCPDCSSPAAGARSSTSLDVYLRGTNDMLWISSWTQSGGWTGFGPYGGVLSSSPGTVTRARTGNDADLIAIMPEERQNNVWHYGTWWKRYQP